MLPGPEQNQFEGEMVIDFNGKWPINVSQKKEGIVWESINQMETMTYWDH